MTRDTRVLALLWSAAVIAVVFLYIGRQAGRQALPAAPEAGAVRSLAADSAAPDHPRHVPSGPARAFRGDSRHTGRTSYVGPGRARLRWSFKTADRITAQAVTDAQGRVYFGSHDGHLYALTASGQLRWRRFLGQRRGGPKVSKVKVYATPLIGPSGNLYIGSDSNHFWSFDPEGRLRFKIPTEGNADTGTSWSSAGQVHFCAGRHLYAVTPEGEVRWRYEAFGKLYTTPAVGADGTVYVGSQDDHVYAVGAEGALRWSFRAGGDVDSSPLVAEGGLLYVGADDGHVHALGPDGALRWSRPVYGYVRAPLALGLDGSVIAGVFGPKPRLVALDPRDGSERWSFAVSVADSAEIGVMSAPLVDAAGQIYFGAHDDHLYAITAQGQLRWAFAVAGDVDSAPILSPDGSVIFGSDDGHLYALVGGP